VSKERASPPVPTASAAAVQNQPNEAPYTLTLLQANLLVAMLGGFWARQADGHPGSDLMGRGLLMLNALVSWERIKKKGVRKKAAASPVSLNGPNSSRA
jgi:hypothetical protein